MRIEGDRKVQPVLPPEKVGDKPKERELPKPMQPKKKRKPEGKGTEQTGPDEGGHLDVTA